MRSLLLLGLKPLAKLVLFFVTDQILAQIGVEGTGQTGTVSIYAAANTGVTGVNGTATLGNISLVTNNIISETGVAGTTALGTVSVVAEANVEAAGESASAVLGKHIACHQQHYFCYGPCWYHGSWKCDSHRHSAHNRNWGCRYNCIRYSVSFWCS
jgi:hypothetical protein